MESGNRCSTTTCSASRAGAPARLLPAHRRRRRGPLRGPLLPRLPPRAARPPTSPSSAASRGRRTCGPSPLAGPDLCRRRRRGQPARRVRGARHRRDPARGHLGGGRRPLRPLAGSLCWFRRRSRGFGARGGSRASACSRTRTASTTSGAVGPPPRLPLRPRAGMRAATPRTAPLFISSAPSSGPSLAAMGARYRLDSSRPGSSRYGSGRPPGRGGGPGCAMISRILAYGARRTSPGPARAGRLRSGGPRRPACWRAPRIYIFPTASGGPSDQIGSFYNARRGRLRSSDLSLFASGAGRWRFATTSSPRT